MRTLSRGIAASLLVLVLVAQPAGADEEFPEDQVSFQVEAEREVENDRAVAVLGITAEHRDPAQLAGEINAGMRWALDQLPGEKSIKASSGTYRTYPVYDDNRIERWRGRQELRLESADIESLSQTLGVLQERLQIQSLNFSVSPEKRRELESALIREALAAFRQRAQLVRESLEADGYSLMDVNLHTGGVPQPRPLHAEAMVSASRAKMDAPAVEQGTSRIRVQVSGRIRLLRD